MDTQTPETVAEATPIVEVKPDIPASAITSTTSTTTVVAVPKKMNKVLIALLGFMVLVIIFAALGIWFVISNYQKMKQLADANNAAVTTVVPTITDNLQPIKTTNPLINISTNDGLKVRDQSMLYVLDGEIYKLDLVTLAKTKLNLPGVEYGGGSSASGQTGPMLSTNGQFLAATSEGRLNLYDLQNNNAVYPVTLPVPAKGSTDIWIGGFTQDSSKLLVQLLCVENIGDGDNFVECEQSFKDNQTGFFYYDLLTNKTSRIPDTDKYLQNYSDLLGWAKYSTDSFLIIRDIREESGSLSSIELTEINAVSGKAKVIKTLKASGATKWIVIEDVDSAKNILYAISDNTDWDLYYAPTSTNMDLGSNAQLVKHVTGFTSLQGPKFINGNSNQITHTSDYADHISIVVLDITGKVLLDKSLPFDGGAYPSYNQYGTKYYIESSEPIGTNIIIRDGWKTLINIPGVQNADLITMDAEIID